VHLLGHHFLNGRPLRAALRKTMKIKIIRLAGLLILAASAAPSFGQDPGFLGIASKKLDAPKHCVKVERLYPDGPGDRGGVLPGDIILSINGVAFDCAKLAQGTSLMPQMKVGDVVTFGILRGEIPLKLEVVASAQPVDPGQAESALKKQSDEILQNLVKLKGILTLTKGPGGALRVSGPFSQEEAGVLEWHFEQIGLDQLFLKGMRTDQQHLVVKFDSATGTYKFDLAETSE
jgi:hypothetical protein